MVRNLFGRRGRAEVPEDAPETLQDAQPEGAIEPQLDRAVEKTRSGAFGRISELFRQPVVTEETWEELESLLIQADVGPKTALELVEQARQQVSREETPTPVSAETALRRQMVEILGEDDHQPLERQPPGTVILLVGVNGSGKTTSSAKLAKFLELHGRSTIFAAADTFRAAAIDQLRIWAERLRSPIIAHQPGADPGAVVFDAVQAGQARGFDFILVDTAGRLHTKFNLMEELQKIRRVAEKIAKGPIVSLLVLDATSGQNAILQAKTFLKTASVDGIILAKLDGTAKGGVAFAVYNELKVPIWFAGTGEKLEDFAPFDHLAFVNALFSQP